MRPPRWILQFSRGERSICGVLATPDPWTFRWHVEAFRTRAEADRFLRALALEEAQRARAARRPGLFHSTRTEVTDLRLAWCGNAVEDGFADMVRRAVLRVEREARRAAEEARRRLCGNVRRTG